MPNPLPTADAQALLEHLEWVRRLARGLIAHPQDAEDLVQETWLAATRRPPRPGPLRGWLAQVVRNAAREQARRDSRRLSYESDAARSGASASSVDLVARASTQRHVVELVLALEEPYREVVLLRYFEGLSPKAIARRTGDSLATVKTRLRRALAALRARLDRASDGDGRSWLAALGPVAFGSHGSAAALGGVLLVSTKFVSIGIASLALVAVVAFLTRNAWISKPLNDGSSVAVAGSGSPFKDEQIGLPEAPPSNQEIHAGLERQAALPPEGVRLAVIDAASNQAVPDAEVWFGKVDDRVWDDRETDREVLLRADGKRLVCDERGEARLPLEGGYDAVIVRRGELYGEARVWPEPSTPIVLAVAPDRTLTIQVVDETGQPLGNVLAGIRRAGYGDRLLLQARTSTPDGLARLPHVDQRVPELRASGAAFVAAIDGILAPAVEVTLDPLQLPLAPVRLVMPATGRLVVVVEDSEENAARDSWVYVHPLSGRDEGGRVERGLRSLEYSREGRAVFHQVGLGLELEISAQPSQMGPTVEVVHPGPQVPGEEVVVTLQFVETYPLLTGRVLDEQGEPVTGVQLGGSVHVSGDTGEPEQAYIWVSPESDGSFQQPMPVATRSPVSIEGSLKTGPQGNSSDVGARVLFADIHATGGFSDGVINLGDIVLREPPVVLAGKVLDSEGQPVHWALVDIAKRSTDYAPPWDWVTPLRAYTNMNGEFTCVGRPEAEEYAYVASARGYSHTDFVPFTIGQRNTTIVLDQDGALEGSLLAPAGVPAERFEIDLFQSDAVERRAGSGRRIGRALPGGRFLLEQVSADRYDVWIRLAGTDEPMSTVAGVQVEAGEITRDPRLQGVDLRDRLRVFELVLEGPNRTTVGATQVAFWPTGTASETRPRRVASADSNLTILSPWPAVDVEVQASGYRTANIEAVSAGRRVVLQEGIPLALALAPGVDLPQSPIVLRLLLIPEHLWRRTFEERIVAEDGSWSNQWYSWLQQFAPVFDASRRVDVRLPEPGNYVVEWQVAEESIDSRLAPQRIRGSEESKPLQVLEEDAGRVVEFGPDPEELRKAVENLNAAR